MSQPPHDGGNKVEEDNDNQRGQQLVSSRPQVGCTTRPQSSGTSLIQSNATNAIRQNADDESLDGILKSNPRDFKIVSQNWVEEWVGLMACDQLMYFDERHMLEGYNRSLQRERERVLRQNMSKYTSKSVNTQKLKIYFEMGKIHNRGNLLACISKLKIKNSKSDFLKRIVAEFKNETRPKYFYEMIPTLQLGVLHDILLDNWMTSSSASKGISLTMDEEVQRLQNLQKQAYYHGTPHDQAYYWSRQMLQVWTERRHAWSEIYDSIDTIRESVNVAKHSKNVDIGRNMDAYIRHFGLAAKYFANHPYINQDGSLAKHQNPEEEAEKCIKDYNHGLELLQSCKGLEQKVETLTKELKEEKAERRRLVMEHEKESTDQKDEIDTLKEQVRSDKEKRTKLEMEELKAVVAGGKCTNIQHPVDG